MDKQRTGNGGSFRNIGKSGLPARLRELRTAQGMSITDLAHRTGLTARTVRDIENGRRERVLEKTLLLLSEELECPLEDLFRDEDAVDAGPVAPPWSRRRFVWFGGMAALVLVALVVIWNLERTRGTWIQGEQEILMRGGLTGRILWRHATADRISKSMLAPWSDDELLVGLHHDTQDGGVLLCLDLRSGDVIWRRGPDLLKISEAFGPDLRSAPNMNCNDFEPIDVDGDGSPEVAVRFTHFRFYPGCICLIGPDGTRLRQYTHWGHLVDLLPADLDDDGKQELVVTGSNNAAVFQAATVVVLDDENWGGVSFDALSRPEAAQADSSRYRVLLPNFGPAFVPYVGVRPVAWNLQLSGRDAGEPLIYCSVGVEPYVMTVALDRELRPVEAVLNDVFTSLKETLPSELQGAATPFDPVWREHWLETAVVFEQGMLVRPVEPPRLPLRVRVETAPGP